MENIPDRRNEKVQNTDGRRDRAEHDHEGKVEVDRVDAHRRPHSVSVVGANIMMIAFDSMSMAATIRTAITSMIKVSGLEAIVCSILKLILRCSPNALDPIICGRLEIRPEVVRRLVERLWRGRPGELRVFYKAGPLRRPP
jgi:hypothetical protein